MAKVNMVPAEFDSRMVEWNLKHNVITREQLKSFLNSLVDESTNYEPLKIDETSENSSQE